MYKVSGTLDGTGAAINVGCGFFPDFVRLFNLESTNPFYAEWNVNMRSALQIGGYTIDNATPARLTESAGIQLYSGEDLADGTETYLVSAADVLGQLNLARKGDTITTPVVTWDLDTSANRTGSFNAGVNTTYVGIGSVVRIWDPITRKEHRATIMVLTNDGDGDDEVELDIVVPSGDVLSIGPRFDYLAAASNTVMPKGFSIATTGNLNSDGETIFFEAGTYK